MGSFVGASRHSGGHDGTKLRPIAFVTSVAPFGVSAHPRLAHVNGAFESSAVRTYEVQETDGVDPRAHRMLSAPAGDGRPGDVTMDGRIWRPKR